MKFIQEVNRETFSNPSFVTGQNEPNHCSFKCICGNKLKVNFERQINNSWLKESDVLNGDEIMLLKTHFNIGLFSKAPNGGIAVFDKIKCKKCGSSYVTFCGVAEFSNSAYLIDIFEIHKIDDQ